MDKFCQSSKPYLDHFDKSSQGISAREWGCHSQVPEIKPKLTFCKALYHQTNLSFYSSLKYFFTKIYFCRKSKDVNVSKIVYWTCPGSMKGIRWRDHQGVLVQEQMQPTWQRPSELTLKCWGRRHLNNQLRWSGRNTETNPKEVSF